MSLNSEEIYWWPVSSQPLKVQVFSPIIYYIYPVYGLNLLPQESCVLFWIKMPFEEYLLSQTEKAAEVCQMLEIQDIIYSWKSVRSVGRKNEHFAKVYG